MPNNIYSDEFDINQVLLDGYEKAQNSRDFVEMKKVGNDYIHAMFGEDIIPQWNAFELKEKEVEFRTKDGREGKFKPYSNAKVLADAFDGLAKKELPDEVVLSAKGVNSLNAIRNLFITNDYLNSKRFQGYGKEKITNQKTGEVKTREVLFAEAVSETLNKVIATIKNKLANNADFFADKKTLEKRSEYFVNRTNTIKEAQSQGIEALMKVYEKNDQVNETNVAEKADKNLENIDKKMAAIDEAIAKTNKKEDAEKAPMHDEIKNLDLDQVRRQKQ